MVMGLRMQFKNPAEAKAAHNSELDALRTQLQEVQAQLETAHAETKAAKAGIQAAEDEVAALRGINDEVLASKEEVERDLTNIRSELETVRSAAFEERARHGSAVASLQATHTQEIARLREELTGNEHSQQRLENELKQRSIALAEAATARKAAEEAAQMQGDQNQQMQNLLKELVEKKAAKEAATKNLGAAEAEGTRLRTEVEQQRKLVESQTLELQKKEEELTGKDKELKSTLLELQHHKVLADEAKDEAENAKEEAEALTRRLDDATTTLAAERRALEEARAVSAMSQREAREACDEAAQLVAVAKNMEAECRTAREAAAKESEEMQRKLDTATTEATELRQQREALQKELKGSYDEAAQRTETINMLEDELKKYRSEAAASNPAQLLLLHDKGREVEQLKKERESISNELERLQLGIAWESASGAEAPAAKDMVFTNECPVMCEYPVKSPKGRPHSRCSTRPRGPGGPARPLSARRSNHAAKRTPSLPGKMKITAPSPCDSARGWNQARVVTSTIHESATLERTSAD